jgi:hypothetical protein
MFTVALFCGGELFNPDHAFEQTLDALFYTFQKEVMPLTIKFTQPFNSTVKPYSKNSMI